MRQLTMKYAGGGIVRHLGLQNYKGPVAALSELIANAWDSDATKVEVTIPLGKSPSPKDEIVVKDNGCGMGFQDCDEKYLVIGRNRRDVERTDRSPGGRRLMAHKGLGKLAGFGIARIVEVKTVLDGKLTHFKMSFGDIDKLKQGGAYSPTMIADEETVDLRNGTEVILKDLSLERAISKAQFFRSMAGRFSIFSDKFKVYLNGTLLKKTRVPLEFRFPEKGDADVTEIDEEGFGTSVLSNGEKIKWWIGFTPDTIKWTEIHGVSVISRGRVAQDPWDFNLAGGTWGQHGLRYMTGEIIAEFVDEGITYESDTIITNRSGLKWTDPKNEPLYEWGRKKIRESLKIWSERRGKKTLEKVKKKYPELVKKIRRFQPRERKELDSAMRSLAQIPTMKPERLSKLFTIFNNHLKSHYVDFREDPIAGERSNNVRRTRQAEMVAEIAKARTRPNSRFIVLGDMNDPPDSPCLQPLVGDSELQLTNALSNPRETRPSRPDTPPPTSTAWTHRYKQPRYPAKYELYDQIWLSPALSDKQKEAWIDRRKRHTGDGSDHDPAWIKIRL